MAEHIISAITELRANKMRSFLTMLGIIIGIASVIAIMTVGSSMTGAVTKSMSQMGVQNINVYLTGKGFMDAGGEDEEDNNSVREMKQGDYFTTEMFDAIKEEYKDKIKGISLNKEVGSSQITNGKKKADVTLTGANMPYLNSKNLKLMAGRGLVRTDFENKERNALVSDKYVEKLYGISADKAVGRDIEMLIDNHYYVYSIVGVYRYEESSGDFSSGKNSGVKTTVYVPLSSALSQMNIQPEYTDFELLAKENTDVETVATQVAKMLNERYYKDNDAYEVYAYSMKSMVDETKGMMNTIQLAISAIAAISLIVGGIGVMNIMMVSITERTREIGTMKAIGATNAEIRLQFILEAVTICVIGGIIGVALGLSLGLIISVLMKYPATPSVLSIFVSVIFSMVFGVFFGYYPANKAAKMNPIEALRYE